MDFVFQPHIHHILMHNQLIILDERNDSYTIFSERQTSTLTDGDKSDNQYSTLCKELASLNMIAHSNTPQILVIANKGYEGIDNYTWRTNRTHKPDHFRPLPTLQACLDLIQLKLKLMRYGLEAALNNMRASKKDLAENKDLLCLDDLERYARGIHISSLVLPFKIKCLESSICLFNHAIKNGRSCDFFIGVQLFDFLSHAWIEVDGQVIADDKDLSLKLPKILTI